MALNLYGETPMIGTVVGVVDDVRITSLDNQPDFQIYLSYLQLPTMWMSLVVRTQVERAAVIDALRAVVRANDADIPLGAVAEMDEIIAASIWGDKVLSGAVALFAAVALLLAALGLYGTLAHLVVRRTQ